MSNIAHHLLDDEELALLLAPVQTSGVTSLSRIISAGVLIDTPIDGVQLLYCQQIGELMTYLLNDTDIDAIILADELLTAENIHLLLPLLEHLEQIKLFILGSMPEILDNFPDFFFCQNKRILLSEIQDWHERLQSDYNNWLVTGNIAISETYRQSVNNIFSVEILITIQQLIKEQKPLIALLDCSVNNTNLRQEMLQLAHFYPQIPLVLISDQQAVLLHSCQHLAKQLKLNVMAVLEHGQLDNVLHTIIVRYYRRYLRWLNHRTIYDDHHAGLVYQVGQTKPYGTFHWPPRSFASQPHYYVNWQILCNKSQQHDLVKAAAYIQTLYQLESHQLLIVFDGPTPKDEQIAAAIELLLQGIRICWVPRSVRQLLNTREQVGISQIFVPLSVWQELVADSALLKRWQTRYEHQQVDIGLLGGYCAMLQYTQELGLTFMAEPCDAD
ncbi:hypothetical protein [Celerinatantimonas yamalensis]|uniref:Uncharacterized protein n=1 Tax=Celerinatantimonas yamalensis TaxID=559956 RepID=A0ABW9G3Y6_9GAMM